MIRHRGREQARLGKILIIPPKRLLQMCPVKTRTWVDFSLWSDVLMSGDITNGVLQRNCRTQTGERLILGHFKTIPFKAFQFNAN